MHESAKKYGKAFFETYCSNNFSGKKIVDVGAQDVNGSLREFCPQGASYIGVDFVEGKGVDIVLTDPYKLPFEDESVDVVVCSSVFEHSEFFWLLFLECLRIIKSDGLLYLNAPSNGYVHRYPIDSWRFYPDAGRSLINWSRRNAYNAVLLESFIAEKQGHITGDGMWNDFVAVVLKDQSKVSLYPHRMLKKQENIFCGYSSDLNNYFPLIVQNPDHCFITEQQHRITSLNQLVSDRDIHIASLNQLVSDRDTHIASLNQLVSDQDIHIARLKQLVSDQDFQVVSLNQVIAERDGQIASINNEIEALRQSKIWRLTAPLRWLVRLVKYK